MRRKSGVGKFLSFLSAMLLFYSLFVIAKTYSDGWLFVSVLLAVVFGIAGATTEEDSSGEINSD